jgi:hypothetical protein
MVEKKSNCCALGVEAGPHLFLSQGGFRKLQITGKAKRERKLAAYALIMPFSRKTDGSTRQVGAGLLGTPG